MFNSAFSEGKPRNENELIVDGEKPPPYPRRLVTINDDYDLFHIVLFFLYTDRVCFTTTPEECPGDIPITDDAEGIYAIAHRLILDSLTSKAIHFLKSTCTIQNITERSFGKFVSVHESVGEVYDKYFMENWDEVIQSTEFEEFFKALEKDSKEYIRANSKLRKMMRSRTET